MGKGRDIPRRIEKLLFQEANGRCLICGFDDVNALVFHHIIPFAKRPKHDLAHMILLCANCHAKADRGEITRERLYSAKMEGPKIISFPQKKKKDKDQVTVAGDGNVTVGGDINISGDLNIKMTKKGKSSDSVILPGTVAENPRMIGYLRYLATRYNEFKKWDCDINNEPMKYPLIYVAYKRELKYDMRNTPCEHFDLAVRYLQKRIENTRLGRKRKKEGKKLFSSFETFDQVEEE